MAQIIYASLNKRTRSFHFPLYSSTLFFVVVQQRKMRIHIRILYEKETRTVRFIVINTWKLKIWIFGTPTNNNNTNWLTDWMAEKREKKNHRNISFSLPLFCLSYWDCSVFQPEPHTYTTHAHTFPWLSVKVKLYEAIWIKYARLAQRCAHMLVCGCNAWLKVSATRCHDTNTRTYCALHCIFCVHCKYVYIQYQFRLDAFCSFLHRSFARL